MSERKVKVFKHVQDMRPIGSHPLELVDDGEATFMEWGVDYTPYENHCGHFSAAIVRREDGKVEVVPAEHIQFLPEPETELAYPRVDKVEHNIDYAEAIRSSPLYFPCNESTLGIHAWSGSARGECIMCGKSREDVTIKDTNETESGYIACPESTSGDHSWMLDKGIKCCALCKKTAIDMERSFAKY